MAKAMASHLRAARRTSEFVDEHHNGRVRPLLLLGVDGVVCPLGNAAPDQVPIASTVVGPGETVKLPAIRRFVGDRAFAWVDDRLGVDATAWASHRLAPTLLRDIDPCSGLTRCDIDALLAFATYPQR